MKNAEKYRTEYLENKSRLKEIQEEISDIFYKYQKEGENPLYDEYCYLVDGMKDYSNELREGKIGINDIMKLEYEDDIVKIHNLFMERKRLKKRVGVIKGVVFRFFLSGK